MYSARPTLLTDTISHVKLSPGEGTQREGIGSALTPRPRKGGCAAGRNFFWLRLTTTTAQCLRRLWALFHFCHVFFWKNLSILMFLKQFTYQLLDREYLHVLFCRLLSTSEHFGQNRVMQWFTVAKLKGTKLWAVFWNTCTSLVARNINEKNELFVFLCFLRKANKQTNGHVRITFSVVESHKH